MADNALGVVIGVVDRLRDYTPLTDIVGQRIYTSAPQQTAFPYCLVSIDSAPYDTVTESGMQHTITVQAFSRYKGNKEALQIRAAVYDALHRQENAIAVEAGAMVRINAGPLLDCFIEPDGVTWQSVIQLDAVVT